MLEITIKASLLIPPVVETDRYGNTKEVTPGENSTPLEVAVRSSDAEQALRQAATQITVLQRLILGDSPKVDISGILP